MFTTITTKSAPTDFIGKLKYRLLPPAIESRSVHVPGGSDYLSLTVPLIKGRIVWNNVRTVVGGNCRDILLPDSVSAPEESFIKPFKINRFGRLLTVNSTQEIIKRRGEAVREISVVDFSGSASDYLKELPEYCRTLKIITANREKYTFYKAEMMDTYGAAVLITNDISKAFDSALVIIPSALRRPAAFSRQSKVFCFSPRNIYASCIFVPDGVNLPEKFLRIKPENIDTLEFAAALYEVSGVEELKKSISLGFKKRNSKLDYNEIISMLDY